jgi:hypothetical protein
MSKPTEFQKAMESKLLKAMPSETLSQIDMISSQPIAAQSKVAQIANIVAESKDAHPTVTEIKQLVSQGGDPNSVIEGVFERIDNQKNKPSDMAQYMVNGAGKVKSDPSARAAIKQGFSEGVVASIKGATKQDRAKMREMVDVLEKGKNFERYAAKSRPSDTPGKSVMDRLRVVKSANKEAGMALEGEAKALKGKKVDYTPAVESFLDDLDDMGVGVEIVDGVGRGIFDGSDIEMLTGTEATLNKVIARMTKGGQDVDAYDVHRLKKYIDENVTYGKNKDGLGGKTERILKSLRRNLDGVLDKNFPSYDAVNRQYSETVNALDFFQDSAGSKIDLSSPNAEKAVGTLTRRLLSNAQSRISVMDSIEELQRVAKKNGGKFDDDILTQTMFYDELEKIFGSSAKTSFQGGIEKGAAKAMVDTGTGRRGMFETGADLAGAALDKTRGVNEEGALKAIKALLNEN